MNRVFAIALLIGGHAVFARVTKDVWLQFRQETFDGKTFAHRVDIIDSVKKETWQVDGQLVDCDTYLQNILTAQMADEKAARLARQKLQDQEAQAHQRNITFRLNAQREIGKKELRQAIACVRQSYKKIKDKRLVPYYTYASHSIANFDALKNIKSQVLAEAKMLLADDRAAVDELEKLTKQLAAYPSLLEQFYQDTVNTAIAQCDDTRLLKDLLALG